MCVLMVAVLFGGRTAQGQSFTLTPSSTSANIIPSPTSAVYAAGTSASTPSWTIVGTCPNNTGGGSICRVFVASSSGTLATARVTVAPATGTGCTGAGGTYTLQSTPTEIFNILRGSGTNSCTTTLTFAVSGLSLSTYQSSGVVATSTFSRAVQFSLTCTKSNGGSCL